MESASDEKLTFIDDSWCSRVMASAHSLQCRHLLCDAVVTSRDGAAFGAHSVILTACNPDLVSKFEESTKKTVDLPCSEEATKLLLEFMYTGRLRFESRISVPFLESLRRASIELGLDALVEWCSTKLADLRSALNSKQTIEKERLTFAQKCNGKKLALTSETILQCDVADNKKTETTETRKAVETTAGSNNRSGGQTGGLNTESRGGKLEAKAKRKFQNKNSKLPSECAGEGSLKKTGDTLTATTPSGLQGPETFKCHICCQVLACTKSLELHMEDHQQDCGKRNWCASCSKSFRTVYTLKRHIASRHSNIRPYQCGDCGASFARPEVLKLHFLVHDNSVSYTCCYCGKVFQREQSLKAHESHHVNPARYQCSICQKTFTEKRSLNAHVLAHEGKRMFKCDACGESFLSVGRLKQHAKTHSLKRTRDHKCFTCGKAFFTKQSLSCHTRSHTGDKPFRCKFCFKAFSQIGNCRKHEIRHRGERPFVCDVCGASFTALDHLKTHAVVHSEDRPFPCTHCDKRFKLARSLKLHDLRIHQTS